MLALNLYESLGSSSLGLRKAGYEVLSIGKMDKTFHKNKTYNYQKDCSITLLSMYLNERKVYGKKLEDFDLIWINSPVDIEKSNKGIQDLELLRIMLLKTKVPFIIAHKGLIKLTKYPFSKYCFALNGSRNQNLSTLWLFESNYDLINSLIDAEKSDFSIDELKNAIDIQNLCLISYSQYLGEKTKSLLHKKYKKRLRRKLC